MNTPEREYETRLAARGNALAKIEEQSRRFWLWRRIVFAAIPLLIVLAFEDYLSAWWIGLPCLIFLVLMVRHQGVIRLRDRFKRAVKFYEEGLARLDDRWAGTGTTGEQFGNPAHPYAEDLDLFGKGSLFELLCRARTQAGEKRLASWLLAPSSPGEIRERQQAVEELRGRLDLREDLALLGDDVRSAIHPEEISAWGASPATFTARWLPIVAAVIGISTLTSIVLWFAFEYRTLALLAILAEFVFLYVYRRGIGRVIAEVERPCRDLRLLSEILERIEREQFNSTALLRVRRALEIAGLPPSRQIAQLSRLIEILDSTKNQFFAPFAFVLLIPAQIAFAIDRWKRRSGKLIKPWIEAVGELEALNSLANFAYENPDAPFPELVEGEALYEAESLGHPLIPAARCVRNDIMLGNPMRVLIVSGSNMSGKSTMLRTIGINAVLAFAGAPVRARRFRLSSLTIGASIHILDSLQGGASRFYAEITRLKQIVELTRGERPVLFLLDEILSGTNSHDRRIGAEAVIKGLVERGALGLTTTHDLALTRMVESLGERAANVHFEDHLEEGKMIFDYRMQPGIVTHSNALELMRAVGLEV